MFIDALFNYRMQYQNLKLNSFIPFTYNDRILKKFKINLVKQLLDIKENCLLSIAKLADKYRELDKDLKFSNDTFKNLIKNKLNYRFGILDPYNSLKDNIRLSLTFKLFINKFAKLFNKSKHFMFFDECSFANTKRSLRGWFKGQSNRSIKTSGRLVSQNLLMAVDNKRVIHYEINDETSNLDKVTQFMQEFIKKINEDLELKELRDNNKLVLILDNASYHKKDTLYDIFVKNKINVLFICPYHQRYNIIESVFSFMKRQFYRTIFPNV